MPHVSASGAKILARFSAQSENEEHEAIVDFYNDTWGQPNGVRSEGRTLVKTVFDHQLKRPILVREEHRALAAGLDEHLKGADRHGESTAFIVYGQPGCGKSLSLHYLLSRRMEMKQPSLYAVTGNDTFHFFCDEGVFVNVPFSKVPLLKFSTPTVLLLDADPQKLARSFPQPVYSSITNFVIVFATSPAPNRFPPLEKLVPDTEFWVLDLWLDKELADWIELDAFLPDPYPRKVWGTKELSMLSEESPDLATPTAAVGLGLSGASTGLPSRPTFLPATPRRAPHLPSRNTNPAVYTAEDCFKYFGRVPTRALLALRIEIPKRNGPVVDLLPNLNPSTVLGSLETYQQLTSELKSDPEGQGRGFHRVLVEIPDPRHARPSRAPRTLVVSPSKEVSIWLTAGVRWMSLQAQQKQAALLVHHSNIFGAVFEPYVLKYIGMNGIKLETCRGVKIPQISNQVPVFDVKLPAATTSFAANKPVHYNDVTSASTIFHVSDGQLSDGLYIPQPGFPTMDAIMIFTNSGTSSRATYCVALQVTTAAKHDVVKDGLVRMLFALGPYAAKVNLVQAFISFDRDRGKKLANTEHDELTPVSSSLTPSLVKVPPTKLKKDNPAFTWTRAYGVVDPVFNETGGSVTASGKSPELLDMDIDE